jgi:hypothetical protein
VGEGGVKREGWICFSGERPFLIIAFNFFSLCEENRNSAHESDMMVGRYRE